MIETMQALQHARHSRARPQMIQALEDDLRELHELEEERRVRFQRRRSARQQDSWDGFPSIYSARSVQHGDERTIEGHLSGRSPLVDERSCRTPAYTRDHLYSSTSCPRRLNEFDMQRLRTRGEMVALSGPVASQSFDTRSDPANYMVNGLEALRLTVTQPPSYEAAAAAPPPPYNPEGRRRDDSPAPQAARTSRQVMRDGAANERQA
ncbi:MAG: hypothetical protein M1835_000166 [Candelina submexicana]|nr:MAG: hypothetical protein M1835_000166 [Candelina submexicana]